MCITKLGEVGIFQVGLDYYKLFLFIRTAANMHTENNMNDFHTLAGNNYVADFDISQSL